MCLEHVNASVSSDAVESHLKVLTKLPADLVLVGVQLELQEVEEVVVSLLASPRGQQARKKEPVWLHG